MQDEGKGLKLLVVDDNVDAADSLAMLLRLVGHEVVAAYGAHEALAAAPGFAPDAVLLDIGLPGMDGYEVARRLRAIPQTRDALLIAVSGYSSAESPGDATLFDRHLVKPVDPATLEAVLSQYGRSARR